VVYESIIDDNRSQNAFGLMMSLNMLIETPRRLRLHRRRLPGLDERGRLSRDARRASGGPGFHGGGDQVASTAPAQARAGCAELNFEGLSVPAITRVRSSLRIDGHHLDSMCSIT